MIKTYNFEWVDYFRGQVEAENETEAIEKVKEVLIDNEENYYIEGELTFLEEETGNKDMYDKVQRESNLFYKRTDGGAEYLCTKAVEGTNIGDISTAVVRIDGNPVIKLVD